MNDSASSPTKRGPGRPATKTKDEKALASITVRMTNAKKAALEALAEAKRQEGALQWGSGFVFNVSSMFMLWADRALAEAGIVAPAPVPAVDPRQAPLFPPPAVDAPKPELTAVASPKRAPKPAPKQPRAKPAPAAPVGDDALRARIAAALEAGTWPSQSALAKEAQVDKQAVSTFMRGNGIRIAAKLEALDRVLAKHGH